MSEIPSQIMREFTDNVANGHVGMRLLSETDRVRVWQIHAKPGERLPVHRHQLNYFWTIHGSGKARSHYQDGRVEEFSYADGDTRHFTFSEGEFFMHDLQNIGETDLIFTTVEFLDSANPPLAL